jgi:hypothetical protein
LYSTISNEAEPLNLNARSGLGHPLQKEAQPHRKKRNSWFVLANERVKQSHVESWDRWYSEDLDFVINCAKNYRVEVKDKKIVLIHDGYDYVLVLDYNTRFSIEYRRGIKHKMNLIIEGYKMLDGYGMKFKATHIVLTIRVSDYHSFYDLYENIKRGFNKFITHLKYYIEIDSYIKFIELGKEHNVIHLHVLIINKVGFINRDIVQKCWGWKDYTLGNVNLSYFDNVGRGIKYISKYITKSINYDDNDIESVGFKLLALLWALNGRVYSTSKRILSQFEFSLDSTRAIQKIRWYEFIVRDPGLQWFVGRFSGLSPPKVVSGEWFYVGSFSPDLVPLPSGIYEYEPVKIYLENLM